VLDEGGEKSPERSTHLMREGILSSKGKVVSGEGWKLCLVRGGSCVW
jgi:hypothetical protein